MHNLAEMLRDQGRFVEAEALFKEVVAAQRVGLGAHPLKQPDLHSRSILPEQKPLTDVLVVCAQPLSSSRPANFTDPEMRCRPYAP